MKQRILFLCTHNSCRSQMTEGLPEFRRVRDEIPRRINAYQTGARHD